MCKEVRTRKHRIRSLQDLGIVRGEFVIDWLSVASSVLITAIISRILEPGGGWVSRDQRCWERAPRFGHAGYPAVRSTDQSS